MNKNMKKKILNKLKLKKTKLLYCSHNKNTICDYCKIDIHGDVSDISGNVLGIYGDVSGISGNVSGIYGNVSDIYGDVSDISGNVSGIYGNVSDISGNVSGIYGNVLDIIKILKRDNEK